MAEAVTGRIGQAELGDKGVPFRGILDRLTRHSTRTPRRRRSRTTSTGCPRALRLAATRSDSPVVWEAWLSQVEGIAAGVFEKLDLVGVGGKESEDFGYLAGFIAVQVTRSRWHRYQARWMSSVGIDRAFELDRPGAIESQLRTADEDPSPERVAEVGAPNGRTFSTDERTLYVPDTGAREPQIWAFDSDVVSGTVTNGRFFARPVGDGVSDGLRIDAADRVWTSGASPCRSSCRTGETCMSPQQPASTGVPLAEPRHRGRGRRCSEVRHLRGTVWCDSRPRASLVRRDPAVASRWAAPNRRGDRRPHDRSYPPLKPPDSIPEGGLDDRGEIAEGRVSGCAEEGAVEGSVVLDKGGSVAARTSVASRTMLRDAPVRSTSCCTVNTRPSSKMPAQIAEPIRSTVREKVFAFAIIVG